MSSRMRHTDIPTYRHTYRHTDIHTDIERLSLARSQDNHGTTGHHKIRMRSPIVERNNLSLRARSPSKKVEEKGSFPLMLMLGRLVFFEGKFGLYLGFFLF